MQLIAHRRNTVSLLLETPFHWGVEVDIRSMGSRLIVQHDPFLEGENFEEWLMHYQHQTLILNVKEEGLEDVLEAMVVKKGVKEYFFLDQSFPFLVKGFLKGRTASAVRISEYESIETALALAGKIKWVWVDCFRRLMLDFEQAQALQKAGFKLCFVSCELQGVPPEEGIPLLFNHFQKNRIKADAVCTKYPHVWERLCVHEKHVA
jgi:hypothetical protein